MDTFHIHIKGLVQGVGFRPHVHGLATKSNLKGYVNNTTDGVHIEITADETTALGFYHQIIHHAPPRAYIVDHNIEKTAYKEFKMFSICHSENLIEPDLYITPDVATCSHCRDELYDNTSRRFRYAFTTCLHCGPRYCVLNKLPYDRINTTMGNMQMCKKCNHEYQDIHDRRFYSQTNSCPECPILMYLYNDRKNYLELTQNDIPVSTANLIKQGNIVAVKGLGGYLLMCDATNVNVIKRLRNRKHRPTKPLAVMYPNIDIAGKDVHLRAIETEALTGNIAPIVLCRMLTNPSSGCVTDFVAPGMNKIGVLLPYTPLLILISDAFGGPMVATSGNISGCPIIYKDEEALNYLFDIADYVLTYDREIMVPQDDSVIQFSETGQQIILRRSRGLAPGYFNFPFGEENTPILAYGGELKSAFSLHQKSNVYVSQYLGDQQNTESQTAYRHTLDHLSCMLMTKPTFTLADSHPGYFVSNQPFSLNETTSQEKLMIQHHKAHFGAVLAENNLCSTKVPILGIVWDGSGYGDDQQIWGGEIFTYVEKEMKRVFHLKYFPHILGDKMNREPRLSALCLLNELPSYQYMIKTYFNASEWNYYQKVLTKGPNISTSSMGRFLDGIACILGVASHQSFEGEAAMKMEALARQYTPVHEEYYHFDMIHDEIIFGSLLNECIQDLNNSGNIPKICRKVLFSLAKLIEQLSDHLCIRAITFSGGVFQNALLIDMIKILLTDKNKLYFHNQLSPNDECIGFGQLACYHIQKQNDKNQAFVKEAKS